MAQENEPVKMAGVIQIDEKPIQEHLGEMPPHALTARRRWCGRRWRRR